jgi:hypothetical protein
MKRYPAYKKTGIDWIGQIPKHWEMNKIGRMMVLGRGRVISNSEIEANPGKYPGAQSQRKNERQWYRMGWQDPYALEST